MLPRISFKSGWRSISVLATCLFLSANRLGAEYVNFEAPHVHPIALTPSGARLLVVNTPDATLEVFDAPCLDFSLDTRMERPHFRTLSGAVDRS